MRISLVVDGIRSDIETIGALGDPQVEAIADRIASLVATTAPTRILEFLAEISSELDETMPSGHVEVRLNGDDTRLAFVQTSAPTIDPDEDLNARITLRIPESLKGRIDQAAASEGMSTNTWIVRSLDQLAGRPSSSADRRVRVGKQLKGFGRS